MSKYISIEFSWPFLEFFIVRRNLKMFPANGKGSITAYIRTMFWGILNSVH
jgi:hypothetical protein